MGAEGRPSKQLPVYSLDEVAKHNKDGDLWVVYKDKVLDLTTWANRHPGGKQVLIAAAGTDATDEMIGIALATQPTYCCLVPEKREELTTEGGLDVAGQQQRITAAVDQLANAGIHVSLFIDPNDAQIDAAKATGAPIVELHTGAYAEAETEQQREREFALIAQAAAYAEKQGLQVNVGHGLHYHNTLEIAQIPQVVELNIGHSIIARAVLVGLDRAVRDMKAILERAR